MADVKISALPAALALTGAETLPGVQGGVTVALTTRAVANLPPTVGTATTGSATVALNADTASSSGILRVLLTQSATINLTGAVDGQRLTLEMTQDATGGRVVTLGSMFAFGADLTSFTATTAGSKTDIVGVQYHAASSKYRVLAVSKGF
jgi:hypothetical protein